MIGKVSGRADFDARKSPGSTNEEPRNQQLEAKNMASTTTIRFSRIAVSVEEGTAHLTLRHPPLNVLDIVMMEELSQALAGINAHPEVSVIVIAGSGKTFSVGVDVAAHTPDKVEQML